MERGEYLDKGPPLRIWGAVLSPTISVELFVDPSEQTAVGDENARTRLGNRKFYGWLVFFAYIAVLHGRRVVQSPTTVPDNKNHCDLCFPINASEHSDAYKVEWALHRELLCADLEFKHWWEPRSDGCGPQD